MYCLRCYYSNLLDEQKAKFLFTVVQMASALVPKGQDCIDLFFSSYSNTLRASRAIASDYPFITQTEIDQDRG